MQGEGGCLDCGSHGGIGLIDRVLEVLGGLVERRVGGGGALGGVRFGFASGGGATDAIFIVRRMREICLASAGKSPDPHTPPSVGGGCADRVGEAGQRTGEGCG